MGSHNALQRLESYVRSIYAGVSIAVRVVGDSANFFVWLRLRWDPEKGEHTRVAFFPSEEPIVLTWMAT
jgi:hypothetical protein